MTGVWQAKATWRLAAFMAIAVMGLSLGAMVLQYRTVEQRLTAGMEALLAADLDGFAALYEQRRIIALRQAIEYRAAAATGGEVLLLLDRQGRALAGTQSAWPVGLGKSGEGFAVAGAVRFEQGGQRWLGVARDLPGGFPLLVARSLASTEATLISLRRGIWGLAAALLVAGAAVGWVAARGVMGRIGRINGLLDRVAGGALDARLPGGRTDDEFGLLEGHVHSMLDRIQALNRATHRLSDSIAHELRTPLNRMLQKLSRIEGQAVADELRTDLRAAVRVFDALLDISRAEADAGAGGLVPVDLSAVATEVWELYEPLAEDKGLRCEAAIATRAIVLGDRTLIAQMMSNLLENAIKYCKKGDTIQLSLHNLGSEYNLSLADTGPGLPPEMARDAFEPFVRAVRDREKPGHGLGLTLVKAIAARHGACLRVPPVEKGFVLEIGWPKLPS
ncbi:MAG: ATP-binding protein [Paracoccaceae bacterium]